MASGDFIRVALTDGTTTLNLANVSEGVDGATFFIVSVEPREGVKYENGQTLHPGIRVSLDMRALRTSGVGTQLNTWATNLTALTITAISISGATIVGPTTIVNNQQFSTIEVVAVQATLELSGLDYVSGFRQYTSGSNLLGRFNQEAGNGTTLFGWTVDSGAASETGGAQTQTDGETYSQNVLFPFQGRSLTFSFTVNTITGSNWKADLDYVAQNGSTVAANSTALTISGTGRQSLTVTTPSSSFVYTRLRIYNDGGAPTDAITFTTPAIRTDGGTTFTSL